MVDHRDNELRKQASADFKAALLGQTAAEPKTDPATGINDNDCHKRKTPPRYYQPQHNSNIDDFFHDLWFIVSHMILLSTENILSETSEGLFRKIRERF